MAPPIWNLLLLAFFLAGRNLASPQFEKVGSIYGMSSLAHLHVEVNISQIYETAANLTKAVDRVETQLENVRHDGRCGPKFPHNGRTSHCRLNSMYPCCSTEGFCIADTKHHTCVNHGTLVNNRKILLKGVNELKRSMNDLADILQPHQTRHKRSVVNVNLDLGNVFMHVMNGIASIFNYNQMNHLKTRQQHMIKNIKILEDRMNKVYKAFLNLEFNVHDMTESVYDNSRTLAISAVITETTDVVRRISKAVIHLNSGILSPEILPVEDVDELLPALKNQIHNEGYSLETTETIQVYSQPFSFMIENGILDLFIHFKAFNPLRLFSLWQYIDLPFFVDEEPVRITDSHRFLAFNEETENVMVLENLNDCYELRSDQRHFICPKTPIMKKYEDLCLPSLFTSGNLQNCAVEKTQNLASWFVSLIGSIAVFLPEPTTLIKTCRDGPTTTETVSAGVQFLNHSASCAVHSDHFWLPSQPQLVNHSIALHSVSLNIDSLPEIFSENKPLQNSTEFPALEIPPESSSIHEVSQTIFITVTFMLVVSIIGFILYLTFSKPTNTVPC